MNVSSVDLLPPLFDQVASHYSPTAPATGLRQSIVQALQNIIFDAAAAKLCADRLSSTSVPPADHVILRTFDRLSGPHLSRTYLTQQIAAALSLNEQVVDIALLLIEAQIDLRFKSNDEFSFDDISFQKPDQKPEGHVDSTAWCHDIVALTLRVSTQDRPNIWNRMRGSRPEGLRVLVESLQLSATLREAAPYCIGVVRSKVEQRVSDRKEFIRLLHISDLHLVEDLTNPQRGGSPTLGQKKHNYEAVRGLSTAVLGLQPVFDVVVATGDLTTDGARGSLETVLQYVQGGSISGENKMRISLFGLGAGRDKRLLLPGNHDRFEGKTVPGQRFSNLFEEVLGTMPASASTYPYLKAFQAPGQDKNPLTLLFFIFDSNLLAGPEDSSVGARLNALSQGRINAAEVERAVNLARDARTQGQAPSFTGDMIKYDPENSVSIALLHHHPVAKYVVEPRPASFIKECRRAFRRALGFDQRADEAMKLHGADFFLEGCLEAGIQLVLFGHNHYPYRRVVRHSTSGKKLRAFCCPTTLELSKHGNGFHIIDFMDRDTFSLDFYLSRMSDGASTSFSRLADLSGKFQFNKFSEDELSEAYDVKPSGAWPESVVVVPPQPQGSPFALPASVGR